MSGVVIDTSAVVAILTGETGADTLADALESATPRGHRVSFAGGVGIVLESRYGSVGGALAERFVRDAAVEVHGFQRDHADGAMEGWRRFGKGRHRTALNLGDSYSYGLAAVTGYPVLCTGEEFAATDVAVIRPPAS